MKNEMAKVLESVESRLTRLETRHSEHTHDGHTTFVYLRYGNSVPLQDVVNAILKHLGVELEGQNCLVARKTSGRPQAE